MASLTNCLSLRSKNSPNHPASSKAFPFMSLPTELRLNIAELALSHPRGFKWHWKSETPDHRIGHFVPKSPRKPLPSDAYRSEDPFTLLCVSRQLRRETSHLWLKTATLYFDGDDKPDPDAPPDGIWNPCSRRAVCAYEFFTTHPRTCQLPHLPPMILNPSEFGALPSAIRHLIYVTQEPRLADTRVIMPCTYAGEEAIKESMRSYARHVYLSRETVDWADDLEMERNWRIWPDPEFVEWIATTSTEEIKEEIVEIFYEASIELIRNGM